MVYFISDGKYIKIGFTQGPASVPLVAKRLRSLQTGNPARLALIGVMDGELEKEAELHQKHAEKRVTGEWFFLSAEETAEITNVSQAQTKTHNRSRSASACPRQNPLCLKCKRPKADAMQTKLLSEGFTSENLNVCCCNLPVLREYVSEIPVERKPSASSPKRRLRGLLARKLLFAN